MKNKHEIWELRQMQALPLESKVAMTKRRIQTWVDEFGVVGRTAEAFGREADWLEELKRYRDLEEQGRLLVLPCKAGKYEKRLVDLEKAMDESTLYDWYATSVVQTDTPVWTEEHIEELLNDFYVIPKDKEE